MNTSVQRVNGHARPIDPTQSADRPAVNKAGASKSTPTEDGGKKPSAAMRLVALARERYAFVMSTDGRPYAVAIDGPNLALPLRGRTGLRQRLARLYADTFEGDVASQSALADAMTVLEGIADSGDPVPVHLRVGNDDSGRIVVDLGTADGRAVTVSGADGWHVVERSPVLFRRSGAMAPMPTPVLDGDGLARLHGLLNMDETTFRQLVAWLVAAWIPTIPHPVLTFKGEQGTGKSKTAQMVVNLIDPSPASKRSQPRDIKAWSAQAFNSWALCLDNISTIPPWLSDTLCKAVTGDGIVDRALYTDDDVVVLSFRRVLAMTTIDAGALAGDLAERLLMLDLQLIEEDRRRTEEELDGAFEAARPSRSGSSLRPPGVRAGHPAHGAARLHAPHGRLRPRPRRNRPGPGLADPGHLPHRLRQRRGRRLGRRPVRLGRRCPGRTGRNLDRHRRPTPGTAPAARWHPAAELAQGRHPRERQGQTTRPAPAVDRYHRGRHAA